MKVLLGFIILAVVTVSGLYVAAFIFNFVEPFLTHPITVTVFLTFLFAVFVNIYKRGF
jgi:hypothetical protein